jgi:hypothetical protein
MYHRCEPKAHGVAKGFGYGEKLKLQQRHEFPNAYFHSCIQSSHHHRVNSWAKPVTTIHS